MMRYFTLLLLLFSLNAVQAQNKDTLDVMVYNLLNFPDGSNICGSTTTIPARWDTLQKILGYANPDVFMVCELQNEKGADSILNRSLNANGNTHYQAAQFVPNQSTLNELHSMLYFNTHKLGMKAQDLIKTDLRDVNKYTLFVKDPNLAIHNDTTFIDFYVTHLKAGQSDSLRRRQECDSIRKYVDTNSIAQNAVLAGDFNFYTSDEPGYQRLLTGVYPFHDPVNAPGNWHNNFNFDSLHTQSSREFGSASMDCGATGGIDDRFDFLLMSESIIAKTKRVAYIPNTYRSLGNTGFLFNDAINDPSNSSGVPEPILNAMYHMSDHLPVMAKLEVTHPAVSLPIEWTKIQGEAQKDGNHLDWSITDANDVVYWGIERSEQGFDFRVIETLSNQSNQLNWEFLDQTTQAKVAYYRIKAMMKDGEQIYSNTIAIKTFSKELQFRLFPNPASRYISFEYFLKGEKGLLTIYNTLGERVKQVVYSSSQRVHTIDIQDLPTGIYNIEFRSEERQYLRKFIKD